MPPLSPPQPDTASRGPATKRCSHCHSEQPLEAFRHNQRAPDGRAWACRTCMSQQARARYIQRKIGAGAPVDADWDRPIDRAREKRCSHCRQVKPLDAFGVDRSRRSGRRSWCRACGRARVDAHRRARGLPELERDVVIDHTREKRCSRCREIKPLSAFHHNRSQTGGRYAYCRDCVSARYQEGVRAAGSPVVPSAPVVHPGADGGTDGRMSDTDQTRPIDRTREKRCGRCRETKPLSAFRRNRSMRDGRHGYCRACDAARYREARIPAHGTPIGAASGAATAVVNRNRSARSRPIATIRVGPPPSASLATSVARPDRRSTWIGIGPLTGPGRSGAAIVGRCNPWWRFALTGRGPMAVDPGAGLALRSSATPGLMPGVARAAYPLGTAPVLSIAPARNGAAGAMR